MIFGLLVMLMFLAVIYFHYTQGLFSSTISAILSVLAAVLAFSYHETVAEVILKGKSGNTSEAITLVVLFAVIYVTWRMIFDKVVPRGIRLPASIDKMGGILMGAVAAIGPVGILAVAAQELPFDADILGYTKFATATMSASVNATGAHSQDGSRFNELTSDKTGDFDNNMRNSTFPWFPAGIDDMLVGLVGHLSEGGSLQGSQPLSAIHPDFLKELYGDRAGIQVGASHVCAPMPGLAELPADVDSISDTLKYVRVEYPELTTVRPEHDWPKLPFDVENFDYTQHFETGSKGSKKFTMRVGHVEDPDQMLVVLRVEFNHGAADTEDSVIRFSPGSTRLVSRKKSASGALVTTDYFPVGTLEPGSHDTPILLVDKPDDFLFVTYGGRSGEQKPAVDLVYYVDRRGFLDDKGLVEKDAFFEFKRMTRQALGGRSITPYNPSAPGLAVGILKKQIIDEPPKELWDSERLTFGSDKAPVHKH